MCTLLPFKIADVPSDYFNHTRVGLNDGVQDSLRFSQFPFGKMMILWCTQVFSFKKKKFINPTVGKFGEMFCFRFFNLTLGQGENSTSIPHSYNK